MSKTDSVLSTRVSAITKVAIGAVAAAKGVSIAEWTRRVLEERLGEEARAHRHPPPPVPERDAPTGDE